MAKKTKLKKQNSGLDGLAIQDVIEIPPGENLLGAGLEPLANSLDGWLSISNRSENSIFLHITKDSILLSLKDLSGPEKPDGPTPAESLETHPPLSDSEKDQQPSASSIP